MPSFHPGKHKELKIRQVVLVRTNNIFSTIKGVLTLWVYLDTAVNKKVSLNGFFDPLFICNTHSNLFLVFSYTHSNSFRMRNYDFVLNSEHQILHSFYFKSKIYFFIFHCKSFTSDGYKFTNLFVSYTSYNFLQYIILLI